MIAEEAGNQQCPDGQEDKQHDLHSIRASPEYDRYKIRQDCLKLIHSLFSDDKLCSVIVHFMAAAKSCCSRAAGIQDAMCKQSSPALGSRPEATAKGGQQAASHSGRVQAAI